jgi:anti-sigma regulatory factor (Ser/Thr protein kinase)/serine/threonine protein phosphatase PrpC
MISSHKTVVADESQVGTARRAVAEICKRCGMEETQSGQAAIVVTELAQNLVRHAGGGEIILREISRHGRVELDMLAIDRGPGIANMGEALRDGYSTFGSAGNGLGSIRRLADRFEVFSQLGKGTVVWVYFGAPAKDDAYEAGAVSLPLDGEDLCGDAWDVLQQDEALRVVVADGLGHGAFAHEAAREALAVFRKHPHSSPEQVLELMHHALMKTRGAVGAVVELSSERGEALSAGVGNISMRLMKDDGAKSLISDNGTLGASVRRVHALKQPWDRETLLILHSDGLGSQWNLKSYPGLSQRHPSVIAGVLYRDFHRIRDDVTVVVIRRKP